MKLLLTFALSLLAPFCLISSEISVYGLFQYSITHGNEAITHENGKGYGGGLEYRYEDFSFGADYSFQRFASVGNDKANRNFLEIEPLSIFAKYHISDFGEQKPFFGLGYQMLELNYITTDYNPQTRRFEGEEDNKSEYSGYFLMLGADFNIWESIYLQTYARLNYIPRENESLTYTDIVLTLSYRFKL